MASGDMNTKYFHNFANHNRVRKHIWEIKGDNDDLVNDSDSLKKEAIHHFKNLYKASTCLKLEDQCKLIHHYPQMVDDEESSLLFRPVTMEEMKSVLLLF
jgi:hypothetical protein